MTIIKPYAILLSSAIVTAYLFYVTIPVPNELQPNDEVFWIFMKKKTLRAISIIGENLGVDSHINISRNLGSYSAFSSRGKAKYNTIMLKRLKFANIPVNLLRPKNYVDNGPTLVWFHGGGWVYGNAASDDHFLELLAVKLNILIFSVEYRLAPEYIYPEPFNDCYNAVIYLMTHAQQFHVNPRRIALAGSSAGANLAAAVTLKLMNEDFSLQPILQILIVPCLQAINFNTPSYQLHWQNAFLPQYYMANFWLWYALGQYAHKYSTELISGPLSLSNQTQAARDLLDLKYLPYKFIPHHYMPITAEEPRQTSLPLTSKLESIFLARYFAPLMADSVKNLPPTFVAVAEFDVLRDDGLMYYRRLVDAGNDVTLRYYAHSFHSLYANVEFESAKVVLHDLSEYLLSKL